jgi:hypothetical protein
MDIFARKPAPTKNLPSLRYELFIAVLERKATEAQNAFKALSKAEQTYNLVKEALEAQRLPHDITLDVGATAVGINITVLPTDSLATFTPLLAAIGKALYDAKHHRDGVPSVGDMPWSPRRDYDWFCRGDWPGIVSVVLTLPKEGTRDIDVQTVDRTTTSREYKLVPRDAPAATQEE